MKKLIYIPILIAIVSLAVSSCKKDAVIDGGRSVERVNMSTYDFLQSHPKKMFDTTLLIIDKAGMKELINGSGTFFVPNDFAIANYLALKQAEARRKDERKNFTLDSLMKYTPKMLSDSMGMYFFPAAITRDVLNSTGTEFQTSTAGLKLTVSLESRNDHGVDGVITTRPQYIFLFKVKGAKDIYSEEDEAYYDPSGDDKLRDAAAICQTTGILTNNGVVHVLANTHSWSFKEN